ncbi:nesprin-1-like [Plakobranchus ocellatus]|uniref:Nesprin-1-like n=1 Tax=Plakobranchus ocellatus TaxID=259542 RepID=A0AAV4DVP4_9GAST|nr:nesprin-1-like [Plakobranchus ocellatus]
MSITIAKDRLAETLRKWQNYKDLLESSHQYLTEEFPIWLDQAEKAAPDTLEDAQKQREATQAELEKLYAMKQDLLNAGRLCENTGSTEHLDKADQDLDSPLNKFADQVNAEVVSCINQAEKRLDGLRESIKKWDSVDRMRQELRHWLRAKQEELAEIEAQPAKLHSEAAELDVERLKAFREEVRAKAPAIEELQLFHGTLTQHNPSMTDPVIRAIKDDWEELLGQLDILLHEREAAKAAARNLQSHQDTMDEDLANYVRELERIDRADNPMLSKAREVQRRRCRSTQTPFAGSDSEDDDAHSPWKAARGARGRGGGGGGGGAGGGGPSPFPFPPRPGSRSALGRSPNTSRTNLRPRRPRRPHDTSQDLRNFKKGAAAAAAGGAQSESDDSAYGDTYGENTMLHASSFDTHLDEPSYWAGSDLNNTHTPLSYIESDDESAASYISGDFTPVDPELLRDRGSQTPGHVRTQTLDLEEPPAPRAASSTQTDSPGRAAAMQTSTASLHSIGAQTKRSSGSRADLLRSILLEVKDIKKQQGIDTSQDDDSGSIAGSDVTVTKEQLEALYRDVAALRAAGATGTAATQTLSEQATQTAMKLFPEGDPQHLARQGRLNDMLEEIRQLKAGRHSTTPSNAQSTVPDFDARTPSRSLNRTTPARFDSPVNHAPTPAPPPAPVQQNGIPNGHAPHVDLNASIPGRRRVTQDDLNNISQRLDRLDNYQIQRRQAPPPETAYPQQMMMPPPQPQPQVMFAPPPPPASPRRYRVREFSRSYDDNDIMSDEEGRGDRRGRHRRDGVMDRYHLDDALLQATRASRHLKRMSAKMKRSLRDELNRSRY